MTNERGTVLVLVVVTMVLLLVMGGLAIDLAYVSAARNEIMRSLDAAALAGAGNLWINDSVFPAVRAAAQAYGMSNPFRMPGSPTPVTLDLNAGNAPGGDIVLGVWSAGTFTPSTDGSVVNAVRCQYSAQIPTSFLNLLGLGNFTVNGDSIAVAGPPSAVPPSACVFPMALPDCPFRNGEGGYGTQGCGQPTWTQTPSTTNTSAWVNLNGSGTPTATQLHDWVIAAANGCNGTTLKPGDMVGMNGGEVDRVYNGTGQDAGLAKCNNSDGTNCQGLFVDKFTASGELIVKKADESEAYRGKGWEVYVPVFKATDAQCSGAPTNFTEDRPITTFSRFVITQVINGGWCTVNNPYPGNLWESQCPAPNGSAAARNSSLDAVFGYFQCGVIEAPPVLEPAPPASIATNLRLVR